MANRNNQKLYTVSDPSAVKVKSNHCGTTTSAGFIRMDRAARRANVIESGLNPTSGCGAHGGGTPESPQSTPPGRRRDPDGLERPVTRSSGEDRQ